MTIPTLPSQGNTSWYPWAQGVDSAARGALPVAQAAELIRDAISAALVAGPNITITPNDSGDTITITATAGDGGGSGYTDEQAQDALAALVLAGSHVGISFAYNDAGNALTATVSLTKSDVGLGAVDNTADADKPISEAQQAALDAITAAIPEVARDAVGSALISGSGITITPSDEGDAIYFSVNDPAWGQITGRPTFAMVATSGSAGDLTETSTAKVLTSAERTKLTGVATGATANATDAQLRDAATHTGQRPATSISDFTEAVQDAVAALLGAGSNVILNYDDTANTLTVSATGSGGTGLDVEQVRDAIGVALVGAGLISVTVNDAADTITITTTATANATDAQLRDRSTHTGTAPATSVTGLAAIATSGSAGDLTETTGAKVLTSAERTKLAGIATGATAYSDEAAQDAVAAMLAAGAHSGVTFSYNDAAGSLSATVAGGSTDPEIVRDTIAAALVAGTNITITPNDGADTITIAVTGLTRLTVDGVYQGTYDLDTTPVTPADIGAQPADADLTAIAALDSSTVGVMASDGAGWVRRTYAQVKTALGLAKADVGLANVDNTADSAKPVSAAQQTALDGKQAADADLTAIAALDATTAGVIASDGGGWVKKTYAQLKTALGLVKADVGLGNVDNTADTAKPVSTATVAAIATVPLNIQSASYTLVLSDAGRAVEITSATAVSVTVPPNSSVAFPVGTVIEIAQYGAGQITLAAGSGVGLRTASSLTTRAQYSIVSVRKRATDEWMVGGDLT